MLGEHLDRLVRHPALDDRDLRIILFSMRLQEKGEFVTQRRVAEGLTIGHSTVERRFRRLRKEGFLFLERVNSTVWFYDFSSLYDTPLSVALHPDDPSPKRRARPSSESPVTLHSGDPSPHISKKKDQNKGRKKDLPVRDGEEMRVHGPDGKLKTVIQGIPPGKKKHRDRSAVKKSRLETKEISDYNCNDLIALFYREWRKVNLPGNPTKVTGREAKHLKELIDDQGPENAVKYIQWVFANWDGLVEEYQVSGAPSIVLLYGYRRSWVFRALKNEVPGKSKKGTSEYKGKDDIPSGSWG